VRHRCDSAETAETAETTNDPLDQHGSDNVSFARKLLRRKAPGGTAHATPLPWAIIIFQGVEGMSQSRNVVLCVPYEAMRAPHGGYAEQPGGVELRPSLRRAVGTRSSRAAETLGRPLFGLLICVAPASLVVSSPSGFVVGSATRASTDRERQAPPAAGGVHQRHSGAARGFNGATMPTTAAPRATRRAAVGRSSRQPLRERLAASPVRNPIGARAACRSW
jgi:hypothetical protein